MVSSVVWIFLMCSRSLIYRAPPTGEAVSGLQPEGPTSADMGREGDGSGWDDPSTADGPGKTHMITHPHTHTHTHTHTQTHTHTHTPPHTHTHTETDVDGTLDMPSHWYMNEPNVSVYSDQMSPDLHFHC